MASVEANSKMADNTSFAASADAPSASSGPRNNKSADGDRGQNNSKHGDRGKGKDRGNDKPWKKRKGGSGFGSKKQDVPDKREQVHNNRAAKRRRVIDGEADGNSYMSIPFSSEEIAAEERRPKRKVAVLIGYAGTGYHGIQINHKDKTIEGDIFAAFVAAGAISKANADDPKKSSLVRCARTDKGVHAAGNVLSLKLIIEDDKIVDKINEHLPEQIRVWAIQRTNNAFSCYQACDSRWYEYLMPSYALLPPQPRSFLGKKIAESAKAKGVYDEYLGRLDDVRDFWDEVEKNDMQPILDRLDPDVRAEVLRRLHDSADQQELDEEGQPEKAGEAAVENADGEMKDPAVVAEQPKAEGGDDAVVAGAQQPRPAGTDAAAAPAGAAAAKPAREFTPVELAVREIKAAYVAAKRRYRVAPARLDKLQRALDLYLGTHNFHNYTVLKSASDPSAKRHIKSFEVNRTPIPIRDTEWLSIKIHGQSFMMHQIRKMVALSVMVVRCGAPLDLITESYGPRRISIPKAPGLGLMLERPVFAEYNKRAAGLGKDAIDFAKYEDKISKFKDEHIYRRMFEVEEKENSFHLFFNQVDNFQTDYFLWVTAGGLEASHERSDRGGERVPRGLEAELGDDADGVEEVGT
ncbi:tRNA pseudouridine synthase 1 [Diplogelasinospora grovesii]|uniref:tRNA pseudouridine synthase 1 n=1 Tax=Diplogelasinospora grovesii TaxID=303347 RepID=A0AAN6N2A8_9PEZI|nr:tRNA pseudouridine synthase 1 [Diplogelasinospora grovesii]